MGTPKILRVMAVAFSLAIIATACGGDAEDAATDAAAVEADADVAVEESATTDTEATYDTNAEVDVDPDDDPEQAEVSGDGVDLDLFYDGALAGDVVTGDCTLSGGEAATCYTVTVAGYPADVEIGPFCPTTIEATADDVGIWFDGDSIYDLDGDFIVGLAELYADDNWLLYDEGGNVFVTETEEAFDAAARPNVAAEYQNHCVEGRIEWLPGSEPITATVTIPTTPVPSEATATGRGNLGVTLNGVVIAASAPVSAILGAYTIAAFDDCGGHVNPHDGYHLHGAVGCSEVPVEGHAAIFGYALDGYGIYSPTDAAGTSYDDLDACGGHTTEGLGYHYHASSAEKNAVITCFSGQTAS